MKVSAHCLVKNEDRFIWYSIMSVINYVDVVRIWDTGSTDNTLEVIEEIQKRYAGVNKIIVNKFNLSNFHEGEVRQQMLDSEDADWFLVLDADEIWWDDSIKLVAETIRKQNNNIESIVVPTVNLVGDIFHYQEKEAGRYNLAGKKGHFNLRAINRSIPGLSSSGEHGLWGWVDNEGVMIQNRDVTKTLFVDAPYLHATHLERSGKKDGDKTVYKRAKKLKYELGNNFPLDYYYPEVFFRSRPQIVSPVWKTMSCGYTLRAFFETPLRKINRRIMPAKIGY